MYIKKIFLFIILPFLLLSLYSCWNNSKWNSLDKEEITSTSSVINNENNNITSTSSLINNKKIEVVKDIKDMNINEINNSLYSINWVKNLKDKINNLSLSWSSIENISKSIYLKSFLWNYNEALEKRDDLCKTDKNSCKKVDINLTSYRPEDMNWNILTWVTMSVDWKYIWDLKGKNTFNVYNNFVHRIKLSKKGYLDFYYKIALSKNWLLNWSLNPKFVKAYSEKTLDTSSSWTFDTKNFSYKISPNSFSYNNWITASGNIDIYFFDISSQDWDINALNLDAFDNSWSYLWNSMVTHWMPFVKAYKWDKELVISKPIIWKGKIQNLSKSPNIDLDNVPKNEWLWIEDFKKYNIPPFWSLNQDSWVWLESKMKLLDSRWNYEFQFN